LNEKDKRPPKKRKISFKITLSKKKNSKNNFPKFTSFSNHFNDPSKNLNRILIFN
jgi:hypothetical protein